MWDRERTICHRGCVAEDAALGCRLTLIETVKALEANALRL